MGSSSNLDIVWHVLCITGHHSDAEISPGHVLSLLISDQYHGCPSWICSRNKAILLLYQTWAQFSIASSLQILSCSDWLRGPQPDPADLGQHQQENELVEESNMCCRAWILVCWTVWHLFSIISSSLSNKLRKGYWSWLSENIILKLAMNFLFGYSF